MDGKPQLKLVIFCKSRLELSGEASAAERDQAKDNVFRPGCKFYSLEATEPLQELEGFKKCSRFFFRKVLHTLQRRDQRRAGEFCLSGIYFGF